MNKTSKEQEPELGFVTEVYINRVIDGDTIEVRFERTFNVRLDEIDIVEKKTAIGQEARQFLIDYLTSQTNNYSEPIKLFIKSRNPTKLMDMNSFERILASVWVKGRKLANILRRAGYEKP